MSKPAGVAATVQPHAYFVMSGEHNNAQKKDHSLQLFGRWKNVTDLTTVTVEDKSLSWIKINKIQRNKTLGFRHEWSTRQKNSRTTQGKALTLQDTPREWPQLTPEDLTSWIENRIFDYISDQKTKKVQKVQIVSKKQFEKLVEESKQKKQPATNPENKPPISNTKSDEKRVELPATTSLVDDKTVSAKESANDPTEERGAKKSDEPVLLPPSFPTGEDPVTIQTNSQAQQQSSDISLKEKGVEGPNGPNSAEVEVVTGSDDSGATKMKSEKSEEPNQSGQQVDQKDAPKEEGRGLFSLVKRFVSFWLLFGWLSWLFSKSDVATTKS